MGNNSNLLDNSNQFYSNLLEKNKVSYTLLVYKLKIGTYTDITLSDDYCLIHFN